MGIIQAKAKGDNGSMRDVLICKEPKDLERCLEQHSGTIVALKYAEVGSVAQYHIGEYTLDNIGYQVNTPNGIERAYNLNQNGCVYGWGVLLNTNENKNKQKI